MTWRMAESLEVLKAQIDKDAPKRSKVSDGSIGDADHASRDSDHNPWCAGNVVTARDFTHDPKHGASMRRVTENLRKSRDPRIKYVIFDGRMFSSYPVGSIPAWRWRPYHGVNPHRTHAHVSVNCNRAKDSRRRWRVK